MYRLPIPSSSPPQATSQSLVSRCDVTSSGKRKRSWSRAVFSNLQRKGLERRFQIQKYITKPDRRQLAATLGLTDAQVGGIFYLLFTRSVSKIHKFINLSYIYLAALRHWSQYMNFTELSIGDKPYRCTSKHEKLIVFRSDVEHTA